jgi:hypothetical protein
MFKKIKKYFKGDNKSEYLKFINHLNQIYIHTPIDFGGGCSHEKALVIGFFIKEFNFQNTVDIGVYRGRSLFPQSLAHKFYTNGTVFGIDPYDKQAAIQTDRKDISSSLSSFVEETNFDQIYSDVKNLTKEFHLSKHTCFLRTKSSDAVTYFSENLIKVDLVHIDGNHDTKYVMQDVIDYLPLLKENGIIVLDDISWNSVKPAYRELGKELFHLADFVNDYNDFSVFINSTNSLIHDQAAKIFKSIINLETIKNQ